MVRIKEIENEALFKGALLFDAKSTGLVLGILSGLVIFVATNWLVLKGGHVTDAGGYVVGPHLQLLSQFFIGYRVSFFGSFIGFLYGFAIGAISGVVFSWINNKIVNLRN
jgi:hypothetical protein